jgi:acetyl-CoA synthetase
MKCLCLDTIYGPLSNRATILVFEGIPTYPDVSRFWNIIDKHQVNIFYTAPTAIRSLMAHDDAHVKKTNRQSLKVLGTVGEPINPEAWIWFHSVVGNIFNYFKPIDIVSFARRSSMSNN